MIFFSRTAFFTSRSGDLGISNALLDNKSLTRLRGSNMRKSIFSLEALVIGLSLSVATSANTLKRSESIQISQEIFSDLLVRENLGQTLSSQHSHNLVEWFKSYRQDPATSPSESLSNAPYIDLLLGSETKKIYTAAYSSSYATQYQKIVGNTPLELLFDALVDSIIDGRAAKNPATAASAKALGVCLAKKVKAGKSDSCKLDLDETRTQVPPLVDQATAKLSCFLPLPTSCWTRQTIFQAAKAQLMAARKLPSIQQTVADQFNSQFPGQFRAGFFDLIDSIRADLGSFFGKKTASLNSIFWSAKTPLVEQDDRSTHEMTMKQYASSIDADVMAAAHFSKSDSAELRGYSAPLLYAAAGKLLMITGGQRANFDFKNKKFELGADVATGVSQLGSPAAIPSFSQTPFGGIGVVLAGGAPHFSDWDFGNYDPSKAWQIFPSRFKLGANGVPSLPSNGGAPVSVTENIDDLATLLKASVDFFALTAPSAPLGPYFSGDIAAITDESSPVIFPTDGRSVAIGVIGAVLQNTIDTVHGHLSVVDQSASGGAVQITYYDQVGASGKIGNPVPLQSVAKLMEAAIDTKEALTGDPLVPASLASQLPKLNDAIQIGTFSMLTHGQAQDGGFLEYLDSPQTPRSLRAQIAGLSLLLRYYDVSGIKLLKLNIETAFEFLDSYFAAGSDLPMALEKSPQSAVSADDLWALMRVWDLMQNTLSLNDPAHVGVNWNFNYPVWSARFSAISAKLNQQLVETQ